MGDHDPIDKPNGHYFAKMREGAWTILYVYSGLIESEYEGGSMDPDFIAEWGRRIDIERERRGIPHRGTDGDAAVGGET